MSLTAQQQAVVSDRGGTLLVSAAAGSGKTKVLVDRVMERILKEGKNINEFLIITFTTAAAAELRGKISDAIGSALADQPDNRHIRRQMNLLPLAHISTVHAFCGSLIRQYGYLLEIPSDHTIMETAQRETLLDRVLEQVLEDAYGEMTPGFRLLADTLGAGRNDDSLVDLVKNVFEKMLSQPEPKKWLKEQTLYLSEDTELTKTSWGRILLEDAERKLQWAVERYDWAISRMIGDEKLTSKYLPLYENQRHALQEMIYSLDAPWDQLSGIFVMDNPRVSVRNYPDQELLDAIKEVKTDTLKVLKKLQSCFGRDRKTLITEQNSLAPSLEALLDLVETLYDRFSSEKRRKNLLDFSDQEHLAISLLLDKNCGPTDVAREVSKQFCEIMVDEYQDSNRVQELIYTAISGDEDDIRFLVGDVKQSIYSFRQAEPELFLEKYQAYSPGEYAEDGEPRYLVLSKNFRSRPEILSAANYVFGSIMTPELGGLNYDALQQLYPGLDEYPGKMKTHVELNVLHLNKLPQERDDETNKYQREAAWVADRIVKLLKEQVPVREGDGTRPVRPGDIAVLFRSRDPMRLYRKALIQADVPVISDSGDDIFETPHVSVLLNLLRVLDNPHQDVPLLSVLCSPLFRMSNDQLAAIRAGSKHRRFYDALLCCQEAFAVNAVQRMEEMRKVARTLSAEKLVWHLLNDCGLLTAYCATVEGNAAREDLLQIYDLSRTASGGRHLYLYELVRYLEQQEENGLDGNGDDGDGVILTTIHKSKGLEYPVVFLADLSRGFNFRELSGNILVDSEDGIGIRVTDVEKRLRYPSFAFEALRIKKRMKLLSEELRVLYVAMTRPKDYLIMSYSSGEGLRFLKKLLPGAGYPAEPWMTSAATCLGDWVLLSALSRIESGELFSEVGRPMCSLAVDDYPWTVNFFRLDEPEIGKYVPENVSESQIGVSLPAPARLVEALSWAYSHEKAALTPSKVTATQLKGRQKDEEAAEGAKVLRSIPKLTRPYFILEKKGLTPTEKGTAAHLFLQYADYTKLDSRTGIMEEKERMVDEAYLSQLQADAVSQDMILGLFQSPTGKRLLEAEHLIREFKFSMLTDAEDYFDGLTGEQVLLQCVVDAAIEEDDGLVVIDFKTDRVSSSGVYERAEHYRGQLESYKKALARIFKKPVKEVLLYFLYPGKEVSL